MQTFFAQPASWRGLLLFAGMLLGKSATELKRDPASPLSGSLVSWASAVQSRREDALQRMRRAGSR